MIKLVQMISVLVFLLSACNSKSVPVISSRVTEQPSKVNTPINIKPDVSIGRSIFITRCNRCHDLPKPEQYTAERWDGILSYMIPRSRLDNEQGVHVKAYLKLNAAK